MGHECLWGFTLLVTDRPLRSGLSQPSGLMKTPDIINPRIGLGCFYVSRLCVPTGQLISELKEYLLE